MISGQSTLHPGGRDQFRRRLSDTSFLWLPDKRRNATRPLFHTINKHFRDTSYILTMLKSAESHAHTMIAAMLPYLLWLHAQSKAGPKASALKKWSSPMARRHADDTYWCPKDKCVKNQSDLMLAVAMVDDDDLYWEMDITKPPSLKCKCPQAEEESLDDSVPTINTAMSEKKAPKSTLKDSTPKTGRTSIQTRFTTDNQTVTSQVTTISQLTDLVSVVQQENKMIMTRFDKLNEQIEVLLAAQNLSSNTKHPAGGHGSESGQQK